MTTPHPTHPPRVGVVMGSSSDWDTMQHAVQILQHFGVPHEARVVSAHRMPDDMFEYAASAQSRGLQAIIAGAGGAAHLPGMLALHDQALHDKLQSFRAEQTAAARAMTLPPAPSPA